MMHICSTFIEDECSIILDNNDNNEDNNEMISMVIIS